MTANSEKELLEALANLPPENKPTPEERERGIIVKKAVRCTVCGSAADRYQHLFQCQTNPAHIADLVTGIFSDHSYPNK